ncbi:unnamed protein product, partial [Ectocarpus sp. 13 AM-2016]
MSRAATDGGADMGELLREAAMAAFATIHVAVALYVHEVVFFEELVRDPRFQVKTKGGELGVRMICPSCLTNEFVETPGVSGNGFPSVSSQKLRVAHDIHGVVVPVFGKYRYKNPACDLNIRSARKSAEKAEKNGGLKASEIVWNDAAVTSHCKNGVSFNTMDTRYMQLLPAAVVAKLPYRFFKQNGTSERLLDMVSATEGDTQGFHRLLVARDQGQELRDMQRYIRFAEEEQARERRSRLDGEFTMWPGWRFNRGTLISTPSVAVLNTINKAAHLQVIDHMLRELIAQVAGEFVNSDGTFRAAGKVMDEAQCLYLLMGEDAKILGYGAVKSESEEELTLLFQRYADRRRKKGTLHALRWLYDDRCCRGSKDVTKYYGVQIFPHVERAPLADSFHATQNLAGATTSKSHERRGVYARGVGGSVRSKYKPDVDAVVEYLMRENKRMTRAEAERKAKSKSMSRYVRTVSRPIEETIAEVSEVVRLHARLDAEGRGRGEL